MSTAPAPHPVDRHAPSAAPAAARPSTAGPSRAVASSPFATGPLPTLPDAACAPAPDLDRDRERGDAECLAFFLALVTAALVTAGLALATDLEGLPRLMLALAASGLVGALTFVLASPPREG